MKRTYLLILIVLFCSYPGFSQKDSIRKKIKPSDIINQGDNERYWAQERFDKEYSVQWFEKYKGTITELNNNSFSYNGVIMTAGFLEKEYKIIFEKGIFYPAIFLGYTDGRVLEVQKRTDSTSKIFFDIFSRNDSLGVGIMEEFEFLNPSVRVKRFKLYLSRPGIMNPSMYVFELTNGKATNTTDLKNFLEGASLTFFKFISILI